MSSVSYTQLIAVLFQYGLWPIEFSGDHILLKNPHNDSFLAVSSDPDTVLPPGALEDILEYAGLDLGQFWHLYETV